MIQKFLPLAVLCVFSLLLLTRASGADTSIGKEPIRYRSASVSSSQWADPRQTDQVAAQIARVTECGFNCITLATYRFAPMFFVDYSQTKYPEAVEFEEKTVRANVETLRKNMALAKSKGIKYIVTRSYSHFAPVRFWLAHQDELKSNGLLKQTNRTQL